jgi:hypothetical protein
LAVEVKDNNVESSYVLVDKTTYKTNSLLEAVDILYKTFIVFDVEYPVECQHIWELIGQHFYKLGAKKKNPKVTAFLKKINTNI